MVSEIPKAEMGFLTKKLETFLDRHFEYFLDLLRKKQKGN